MFTSFRSILFPWVGYMDGGDEGEGEGYIACLVLRFLLSYNLVQITSLSSLFWSPVIAYHHYFNLLFTLSNKKKKRYIFRQLKYIVQPWLNRTDINLDKKNPRTNCKQELIPVLIIYLQGKSRLLISWSLSQWGIYY